MSENLGILLIIMGGLASMVAIAFVFIKIMINTTRYSKIKNNKQ